MTTPPHCMCYVSNLEILILNNLSKKSHQFHRIASIWHSLTMPRRSLKSKLIILFSGLWSSRHFSWIASLSQMMTMTLFVIFIWQWYNLYCVEYAIKNLIWILSICLVILFASTESSDHIRMVTTFNRIRIMTSLHPSVNTESIFLACFETARANINHKVGEKREWFFFGLKVHPLRQLSLFIFHSKKREITCHFLF